MPTPGYTNINGQLVPHADALIPANNSAFRYGMGLFETMLVQDGKIRLAHYHWERLFNGLKLLCFDIPALMTPAFLEAEVLRTVGKNQLDDLCRVRLQLYAGSGGIFEAGNKAPLFVIECYPLEPDMQALNENGLAVGIAKGIAKSNDAISNLKTTNALPYAMAARQAKQNKWNDALICNAAGNIVESAIANIFWIKDRAIFTPPLTEGCIAGTMRRHILHTLKNITEKPLSIEALLQADEVFLTNAIKPIRWVREFESRQYGHLQTRSIFNSLF